MKHFIKKFSGFLTILVILATTFPGWAQSFRHPGVINTRESLDFIKSKVAAGAQPWTDAYNELKVHALASLSRSPNPRAIVECGAYSNPNNGCTEERDDAAAAYAQALLWYIEGNAARAQKAIEYMDAWSAVIQDHTEHNARLQTGWAGSNWTKAAEIIRYAGGGGWSSTGVNRFETMLKTVYYPEIQNGAGGGINGNWELTMIDAMIGIGVFTNDRTIFDKAVSMWRKRVPAYIYITSDGTTPVQPPGGGQNINTYWKDPGQYVEGLGQETCRDLGHLTFGFSSMLYTAETALIQNIDLYGEQSRRIRAGLEYNARIQEGWTANGICGGTVTRNMSQTLELGYNHYVNRLNHSMPYTLAFIQKIRPTNRGHHIVWETMTHGEIGNAHDGVSCTVTASSQDGSNGPLNTIDRNLATRWSGDGDGQWIQYCLDTEKTVSGVQIAFFKGNERSSTFDVQVSVNGTSFTVAVAGLVSSGTSLDLETFNFTPRTAKYVRIVGHGNNLNTWNSYTEVEIATNTPPSVSITSPANNATFTAPASVTINANASDANGSISKVEFFQGATKLGEDLTSPYNFNWSGVAQGSYSLTAKATDNEGAVTTSSAVSITVNPPAGLPAPWLNQDVGAVAATGSATHSSGTFTVNASGADIWGTADEFHYVYQTVNGDAEITARVNSVTNTHAWTKAGVMIRESLAASSTHAMVIVSPSSGVSFQRRIASGGTSASTAATGTAPVWLKMKRVGSTFTASSSADGITWTTIGMVTITMTTNVQVGLALTSHADGTIAQAAFSNVSVTSGTPCEPPKSSADDGNVAANVIDNDFATRWSASGDPQWIQLCLDNVSSVTGVQIAFYKGNERVSRFDVQVSLDGTTFTNAATGLLSSGTSLALESFTFPARDAKHVRFVGHGNSLNLWNSYTEVRITSSAAASMMKEGEVPSSARVVSQETLSSDELRLSLYPNPARDQITIRFQVEKAGKVKLSIYDPFQNQSTILIDKELSAGTHQSTYDIKHLSRGVHLIKLFGNGKLTVSKFLKH